MEETTQQTQNEQSDAQAPQQSGSLIPIGGTGTEPPADPKSGDKTKKISRRQFRTNHKATFFGLAAIMLILAINIVGVMFVLKKQANKDKVPQDQVTISQSALGKLGVNRSSDNNSGVYLTIGPNTEFKNKVTVAGAVNISGQLNLNNKLVATNAALTELQAGKVALEQLNVNKDSTVSNLSLRGDLLVNGTTRLQGAVTITKLLTVYSNLNVSGSLSIGGTFSARSLASTSTLTIGGHIIVSGSRPAVQNGSALGSNGTASISGTDAAGTVAVNIGAGGGNGSVATVTFATAYGTTPHVVVGPVGHAVAYYINRTATGFTVYLSGASPGGYAFDYIIAQ